MNYYEYWVYGDNGDGETAVIAHSYMYDVSKVHAEQSLNIQYPNNERIVVIKAD